MIDTLLWVLERAKQTGKRRELGLNGDYVLVTLHRPSNVDDPARLGRIVRALREIAADRTVVFPVRPRTTDRLRAAGLQLEPVKAVEPLVYLEMLDVMSGASVVVTDSGGVQEETTVLGIPCLTVRENTERPVTITEGTNRLVPEPDLLPAAVRDAQSPKRRRVPEGWDGRAGERVIRALEANRPVSKRSA